MLSIGLAIIIFALIFMIIVLLAKTEASNKEILVQGNVSEREAQATLKVFGCLPTKMQKSVKCVIVIRDEKHFVYSHNGKDYVAGGLYEGGGLITIWRKSFRRKVLWHEAAQAYVFCALDREKFLSGWIEIAGNVYDSEDEKYENQPMREGMVTSYSRRNAVEDVAEWVQECYAYLYFSDGSKSLLTQIDLKSDPRYRQKLDYLYQHGFFTKQDYEKLLPLFI